MLKSKKPEIVSTDTKRKRKLLWKSVWNHRELYLLMLPAVIVIILFTCFSFFVVCVCTGFVFFLICLSH